MSIQFRLLLSTFVCLALVGCGGGDSDQSPTNAAGSVDPSGGEVDADGGESGDIDLGAWSTMPYSVVCELMPPDDIEQILGTPIVATNGDLDERRSTCWHATQRSGQAARLEFPVSPHSELEELYASVSEACTIGDRDAVCIPVGGSVSQAGVLLNLGNDVALVATSQDGMDEALAIADLAATNLGL